MKHLSSRPHNIGKQGADPKPGDIFTGYSPLLQRLMRFVLSLLALRCAPGGKRGPKTKALLIFAVALLAALHGGTREDKRAFIKRLFAKHEEIQDRLQAKYMMWRQRKCWAWGGGYYPGALAALPTAMTGARDLQSFDALIPD